MTRTIQLNIKAEKSLLQEIFLNTSTGCHFNGSRSSLSKEIAFHKLSKKFYGTFFLRKKGSYLRSLTAIYHTVSLIYASVSCLTSFCEMTYLKLNLFIIFWYLQQSLNVNTFFPSRNRANVVALKIINRKYIFKNYRSKKERKKTYC